MSGLRVRYLLETDDVDPETLTRDQVVLGWGELDMGAYPARPGLIGAFRTLRQIPDQLRQIADQLESGMTTGPDEAGWLGGPDEPVDGGQ